jgi:transcriptional repressor NrdR
MHCPYCGNENTSVLESRSSGDSDGVRRRRECLKCSKRFTTYERVGNIDLKVEKRSGGLEDFSRDKLEKGIVKACWKRGVSEEEVIKLADEIEMKLLNRQSTTVKSTDIGKLVLGRLKKVDGVAYLRFASVYLDVDNLNDFKEVMKGLEV